MTQPIPFWRSNVILAALAAAGLQAFDILINAPMEVLTAAVTGDVPSIRKLAVLVFIGLVMWARARSSVQPLTIGKPDSAKLLALAALSIIPMLLLNGCATLKESQAGVQLVSQYAVAKYLEQKKTDQARYDAAVRIIKIAGDLRTVTSGTEVRLGELRVYVSGALAAQDLTPADRILANGLAEVLLAELEKRFKDSREALSEWQVVLVNDVLRWIIDVAMTVPNPALERPA